MDDLRLDRHLELDGLYNARDLGGLRTPDGREIRRGAVVRSANLDRLPAATWSALVTYGIRTVIDLRNDYERPETFAGRPAEITTMHTPLDDWDDNDFWAEILERQLQGTPLYYPLFLERKADRCSTVLAAIAQAPPGGVLVHCAVGRDRTGLVVMLLLALVGLAGDDIAADYELSLERLPAMFAALGREDEGTGVRKRLARYGVSAHDAMLAALTSIEIDPYLRSAGVSQDDLAALRARLLNPPSP